MNKKERLICDSNAKASFKVSQTKPAHTPTPWIMYEEKKIVIIYLVIKDWSP
jgi:hypothetical protein